MKIRALPVMIAAVLSMSCAQAAPTPATAAAPVAAAAAAAAAARAAVPAAAPTPEAQAARAEIDRLVERIQQLSKKLGDGNDVRVIVRKQRHGGPMAGGMDDDDDAGAGGDRGDRHVVIRRIGPNGAPMAGFRGMHGDDDDGDAGDDAGGKRQIRIERVGPGMDGMHDMHGMDGMKGMHGGDPMFRQGPGLGIVMAPNPAASGVRVAAITPDSPASKAGIRSGDVILAINGKTVSGNGTTAVDNARGLLGDLKQDQVVKLRYAREGKTFDASVKAGAIRHVMMFERGGMQNGGGDMQWRHRSGGPMLPPGVEMEIERIGPRGDCGKDEADCGMPAIYQAFRWQGLNLSSIDADLGRYFGTDKGVLVTSAGADLKGLHSGDVIMKVAGKPVESPRDVMRALREKDSGSQLQFDVMRNRQPVSTTVTVPGPRALPFVAPPPAPPAAPGTAPPPPALRPLGSIDGTNWMQGDDGEVITTTTDGIAWQDPGNVVLAPAR